MKNLKKLIFVSIFSILLIGSFLVPKTIAQEWTYDDIDTTNIPGFSVYPSEWYIYNGSSLGDPELLMIVEIVKGNITDPFPGPGNGTVVWGNMWQLNITSGVKIQLVSEFFVSYWNETIGFFSSGPPFIIPVENDGKVSSPIMNNVSVFLDILLSSSDFEYKQIYPSLTSFAYWNTSYNDDYFYLNFTDDGILTQWESNLLGTGNSSIISQPAQLSPAFSFTTEGGSLELTTTDFKLDITITDADNNNNGVIDTEYQYRILNGSIWTDWENITGLIDWSIGDVSAGSYPITMEVKNMYGITQEQITIDYQTAPEDFTLNTNAGTPDTDGAFNLDWTIAAEAISYSVYEYSGLITVINSSLTTLVTDTTALSLPLSGYTNGTYYFIVEAHNSLGDTLSNCIQVNVAIPPETGTSGPGIPGYNLIFLLLTSTLVASLIIRKKYKK